MRYRVLERVDFRPVGQAAWIGATIETISYGNDPFPYLVLKTDSFLKNKEGGDQGDQGKLTDCVRVSWEDVLHHVSTAGTHVKEDWRQNFQINYLIEFWDASIEAYRIGKIVYCCRSSEELCLVYHRFVGAPMESIVFPIASKMLRCAWDFFP